MSSTDEDQSTSVGIKVRSLEDVVGPNINWRRLFIDMCTIARNMMDGHFQNGLLGVVLPDHGPVGLTLATFPAWIPPVAGAPNNRINPNIAMAPPADEATPSQLALTKYTNEISAELRANKKKLLNIFLQGVGKYVSRWRQEHPQRLLVMPLHQMIELGQTWYGTPGAADFTSLKFALDTKLIYTGVEAFVSHSIKFIDIIEALDLAQQPESNDSMIKTFKASCSNALPVLQAFMEYDKQCMEPLKPNYAACVDHAAMVAELTRCANAPVGIHRQHLRDTDGDEGAITFIENFLRNDVGGVEQATTSAAFAVTSSSHSDIKDPLQTILSQMKDLHAKVTELSSRQPTGGGGRNTSRQQLPTPPTGTFVSRSTNDQLSRPMNSCYCWKHGEGRHEGHECSVMVDQNTKISRDPSIYTPARIAATKANKQGGSIRKQTK